LLKYIAEFGKYVLITGFSDVKINDVEEFLKKLHKERLLNVEIQFFDAKFVATWQHLYFAVLNALTAFKNKENISKSLAIETMLYASAQRQIQKAMKNLGIKSETSEIALVILGDNAVSLKAALSKISASTKMQLDEAVLKLNKEKERLITEKFGISDLELETVMGKNGLEAALTNLVIERMALLVTRR
jgi:tRNA threonylcarbamoyladenosine modification (KEOPS) complex Cgi121 subunit